MQKLFLILLTLVPWIAQANTGYDGFFDPRDLPNFPVNHPDQSIYKLEISPDMHGTAFSISSEVFITNTHNITRCLRDHGLYETGYDGSRGPLACNSLSLIMPDSSKIKGIQLLGSSARHNNNGWDIAAIRIPGLRTPPMTLRPNELRANEPIYTVGFPSETTRSKELINQKLNEFVQLFDVIFEVQDMLGTIDPDSMTTQEILQAWARDGFAKIQPHLMESEFLSGSLNGSWEHLIGWENQQPRDYLASLTKHLENFKKDAFILLGIAEKASMVAVENYPDADGGLKITRGTYHRDVGAGVKIIKGDGAPGSSGSPVIDKTGLVVGVVFQLRSLDEDSRALCLLDAVMTNTESLNLRYCPAAGMAIVSSKIILKKLDDWSIKLPTQP